MDKASLPVLDWDNVVGKLAAHQSCLVELLETLPRVRWRDKEEEDETLLHHASRGDNARAAVTLVNHGLDVDARNRATGWTPVHVAASYGQVRVLEVLCAAAGGDLRAL